MAGASVLFFDATPKSAYVIGVFFSITLACLLINEDKS